MAILLSRNHITKFCFNIFHLTLILISHLPIFSFHILYMDGIVEFHILHQKRFTHIFIKTLCLYSSHHCIHLDELFF